MGIINNILDVEVRVRHASQHPCAASREGYCSCGNRPVVLSQGHSQQLKAVAGLREVTWFSLCDAAGADLVFRLGRFCSGEPETKVSCVSSE